MLFNPEKLSFFFAVLTIDILAILLLPLMSLACDPTVIITLMVVLNAVVLYHGGPMIQKKYSRWIQTIK
jgi:hypothetical protein